MLEKIKNRIFKRKTSELKNSPGESVKDTFINTRITGNNADKIISAAEKAGNIVDAGVALAGGTESAGALGKILYKTSKDVTRGDTICTGLCVISGTCEAISLCCSTIKIIPFRSHRSKNDQ
uniref:hypothetical protein n=1 Tax=Haramonas pauciplastida TaxID=478668 RepID=UPI0021154AA8|nr:hypothetical protein NQY21_pgp095 [Haramonas pauciplastida]UTE94989.1 hypothetical protein HaraPt_p080 [Haramonas pauciplastida]